MSTTRNRLSKLEKDELRRTKSPDFLIYPDYARLYKPEGWPDIVTSSQTHADTFVVAT